MTTPTSAGAYPNEPTGSTTNPDPEQIRTDIERTRAELSKDVDTLGDRVRPSSVARRQRDRITTGVGRVRDRVMGTAQSTTQGATESVRGTASSVAGTAQQAASSVGDAVTGAPQKVREQTQGNPMAAGLVAFGLGLLAASMVPASSTESRAAGKVRDATAPLVDDLKDAGKSVADEMREPVKENVQGLRESATGAAQDVAQQGKDAAGEVRSQGSGSGTS